MTKIESTLEFPLYLLHYIEDVTVWEGMSEEGATHWRTTYSEDRLNSIRDAVRWAIVHPEHDYHSITEVRHSNEDIYEFLCKFAKSMGFE